MSAGVLLARKLKLGTALEVACPLPSCPVVLPSPPSFLRPREATPSLPDLQEASWFRPQVLCYCCSSIFKKAHSDRGWCGEGSWWGKLDWDCAFLSSSITASAGTVGISKGAGGSKGAAAPFCLAHGGPGLPATCDPRSLLSLGVGIPSWDACCLLLFLQKPDNQSIPAKERIKGKLLNWLKAITHITRYTQAAIYFLIKVLSTYRKSWALGHVFCPWNRESGGAISKRRRGEHLASEFDVAHCYSLQFLLMSISLFKASDLQNSLRWILVQTC